MLIRTEDQARKVLHALADLAPSGEQRVASTSIPTEWFRWLGADSVRLFWPDPLRPEARAVARSIGPTESELVRAASIEAGFAERLASIDQLRPGQHNLRAGWLFVAGRVEDDSGRTRRVFHPLVTVPVRVLYGSSVWTQPKLLPAGDVEVSDLITDLEERDRIENAIELGGGALEVGNGVSIPPALLARLSRLQAFARSAATAAGLPATELVPAGDGPEDLMRADRLVIAAGVGVYAMHDLQTQGRAGSLRSWASGPLEGETAFHSLYVDPDPGASEGSGSVRPGAPEPVRSPFLLTPAQQDAVVRSRHEPITVIVGAPGTGKSHTVVAIACDALTRGESVLVAARSDATVDALLDLLARTTGPEPVVFGSSERRDALAARLSAGQLQPVSAHALTSADDAQDRAHSDVAKFRRQVADQLRVEVLSQRPDDGLARARRTAPGFFDPSTDLTGAESALAEARAPEGGWWRRRRQKRRWQALLDTAGAVDATVDDLERSLAEARVNRMVADVLAAGGTAIGPAWEHLRRLEDEARKATARWLAADSRSAGRLNRGTLPSVSALATALRSGRAARRDQLGRLDRQLIRALPLWVGSLPDIDDLLPAIAGFFDLVILDEASSIDQILAAPALLRARRGVIVGDPQQLRHVSFLSEERLDSVITKHGLDALPMLAARLDLRRNSAFDLAAGVAPVTVLDEHFRSDPHLLEFVAQRLYGGKVKVATRRPSNAAKDCVSVVRLDGHRNDAGVVRAEVDRAIREVEKLLAEGATSVGIVSPFRAQADALEAAALAAFRIDQLEAIDLRIGTVHAFQGNERDIVIASFGIGPDEGGSSWRFIEDPHLFTVLVTRARRHLKVLVSADPPPGGIVADYLAHADSPPGDPARASVPSEWAAQLVADLRSGGAVVSAGYPTGRHVVDICVARGNEDLAIDCDVHPDGPEAHIDRQLSLLRAGWTLTEAFPSRWKDRRGELVIELLGPTGRPKLEQPKT